MTNKGKDLEAFVRQIEKSLLPDKFQVTGNKRIYNDEGVQIAEFDIEIRGKLGSTDIIWLIECRDRPGEGPAPVSWIEQLVGRRQRFGFNKVTAVSTTGFSKGAVDYAKKTGIELRVVKELTHKDIVNWITLGNLDVFIRGGNLQHATVSIGSEEPDDVKQAFKRAIDGKKLDEYILRSTETGDTIRVVDAFQVLISRNQQLYDDIEPDGDPKTVRIHAKYPDDSSHFIVATERRDVRVTDILFEGTLTVSTNKIPVEKIREYAHHESGEPISQAVSFSFKADENDLGLEFRKLVEKDEIQVLIHRKGK